MATLDDSIEGLNISVKERAADIITVQLKQRVYGVGTNLNDHITYHTTSDNSPYLTIDVSGKVELSDYEHSVEGENVKILMSLLDKGLRGKLKETYPGMEHLRVREAVIDTQNKMPYTGDQPQDMLRTSGRIEVRIKHSCDMNVTYEFFNRRDMMVR